MSIFATQSVERDILYKKLQPLRGERKIQAVESIQLEESLQEAEGDEYPKNFSQK